jgi:hypothetical protein
VLEGGPARDGGMPTDLSTDAVALADAASDAAADGPANRDAPGGGDVVTPPDMPAPPSDMPAPPPDTAGPCQPPHALSATASGPLNIMLGNMQLNGGTQIADVAAGATFTFSADYAINDTACRTCRDQIIVGIAPEDPQGCLYSGGARSSGHGQVSMTAPSTPGTYTIRFRYAQANSCDAMGWWDVDAPPGPDADIAVICVH